MSEAMQTVAGNYLGWLLVCAALCSLALLRARVRPVAIVPHAPVCGDVEKNAGYVCSRPPGHAGRHCDVPNAQAWGPAHLPTHTQEGDHR